MNRQIRRNGMMTVVMVAVMVVVVEVAAVPSFRNRNGKRRLGVPIRYPTLRWRSHNHPPVLKCAPLSFFRKGVLMVSNLSGVRVYVRRIPAMMDNGGKEDQRQRGDTAKRNMGETSSQRQPVSNYIPSSVWEGDVKYCSVFIRRTNALSGGHYE